MTPQEMRTLSYKCGQMGYRNLAMYWSEKASEKEIAMNQMRLCDAGIREQEWAQKLISEKQLPSDISYKDFLDHGVYDARTDEILLTVKGVTLRWKVARP